MGDTVPVLVLPFIRSSIRGGNVGISRAVREISKSLWKPVCGFHRDGISMAVFTVALTTRGAGRATPA